MMGTPLASTNTVATDSRLKEMDKLCGDLGGSFCLRAEAVTKLAAVSLFKSQHIHPYG